MATVKVRFRPSTVEGKEGTLCLCVTHAHASRQISTGYTVYPCEWDKGRLKGCGPAHTTERARHLQALERRLRRDVSRLEEIVRQKEASAESYTAGQVMEAFRRSNGNSGNLGRFVGELAMQLRRAGKERLAETYITSVNCLLRFRGESGDVRLDEIDEDMMQEFQAYMRGRGLVPNTTSFYLRNLQAIYNRAVEKGMTRDRSPFRHVYTGVDKTVKRAVPSKVIKRIRELDLSADSGLRFARDLFLFSFYTRGMSFVDMAKLRKRDLRNGVLTYRRQKTGQQLSVKWEKPMREIVSRYSEVGSPYLLPIITTPGQGERRQYLNALHQMNMHMKVIGEMVRSPVPLTSYVARHSWASIARSKNVPVSTISEAMGHDSESTTRIYLATLDTSAIDEANSMVIHSV